ncbi:hypothetical protein T459_18040 [Capsicum annuum]|uniref:HMA domain-containing protein n=1 Tax=Capsicum annuum TaxID=4072 RepID=A0A2G2ZDD2_CAPAN|nr:hypothetical protein T459_18040 [Capsicum annuum]
MLGVLEVSYDPKTNLATIRGNFDPLMVIEAIKRKGKHAELISYSKNPLYNDAYNSTCRNSNHHYKKEEVAAYCNTKDKGKTKVGDDNKRNEHCLHGSSSNDDENPNNHDHDHIHECEDYVSAKNSKCEDFVSNKDKKKYHKAKAYVALKELMKPSAGMN